ncbi:MAG: D-alanine--D-alanine ligase [Fuerstiella sp.]
MTSVRFLVLAGGKSAEREVSLRSGACVAAALQAAGHQVRQIDPRDQSMARLNAEEIDVAIPLVHGTGGEDGVLLKRLKAAGIGWVGSSIAASELTFDKIRTNQFLRREGLPVPDHVVVDRSIPPDQVHQQLVQLGYPVVTKPPRQGSSIGITIVADLDELPSGLDAAYNFGDECLIERFIPGREMTVAICDQRAFPVIEIHPAAWYDYQSKYHDDQTRYEVDQSPAALELQQLALQACRLCGTSGISRVDLRVDPDGNPFVLEINTVPGMTDHSLVPMAAEATGLSLSELWEHAAAGTWR